MSPVPVLPQVAPKPVAQSVAQKTSSAATQQSIVFRFRGRTPMGSETLILTGSKSVFHMLVTMESPELRNASLIRDANGSVKLLDSDGHVLTDWPRQLVLRFTSSAREIEPREEPLEIPTSQELDEFQSSLQFRLKVFHGLETRELSPEEFEVLGVPLGQPSDERIYLVRFDVGEVPVTDRMMLEVLDGDLHRVTKFGLQLE